MRRVRLTLAVLLTGLLASLSLLIGCDPTYKDFNFAVEVKTFQTLAQVMKRGDVFEGYLTVGGGDQDLLLYFRDPTAVKVLSVEVKERYDFFFRAASDGFYIFYFDNAEYLSPVDKQVHLHYVFR